MTGKKERTIHGRDRRAVWRQKQTYLASRDSVQGRVPCLAVALAPRYGDCSTAGTCSWGRVSAFSAGGFTSSTGGADAIVDAFYFASSAAGAGNGGPHSRLLRAPRARFRHRALGFLMHRRQRRGSRGGRKGWQDRSGVRLRRISRKMSSGRAGGGFAGGGIGGRAGREK